MVDIGKATRHTLTYIIFHPCNVLLARLHATLGALQTVDNDQNTRRKIINLLRFIALFHI